MTRVYVLRHDDEIAGVHVSFRSASRGLPRPDWVEVFKGAGLVKTWHYLEHRIELWQVEAR